MSPVLLVWLPGNLFPRACIQADSTARSLGKPPTRPSEVKDVEMPLGDWKGAHGKIRAFLVHRREELGGFFI